MMTVKDLTPKTLAAYFDHTQLKAYAQEQDFIHLCDESRKYGFCMVAINPAPVTLCKKLLHGSGVRVGAAIGFPLGQNTLQVKRLEVVDAIDNGADEIDYMANLTLLKGKQYAAVETEMHEIVSYCRAHGVTSKVIFETCYLDNTEKRELCRIARAVKPDFVKTSTGFGTGGANVRDVAMMKEWVGDGIRVKAAGGIRTLDDAVAMIEAGATRIGSTASVNIVEELARRQGAPGTVCGYSCHLQP